MNLTSRGNSTRYDAAIVQDFASQYIIGQYCQVAIVTVLVYDAMITFGREVEFFWVKSPWFPIRGIYFLNRYSGIFGAISFLLATKLSNENVHLFSSWTYNITNYITLIAIDYILMIRVLALYSQDKKLSMYLKSLLACGAAAKLGFVIYGTWVEDISLTPLTRDIEVCGIKVVPPLVLIAIDWTIPLAYGLLLMVLALYKAVEYWKLLHGFKGIKLAKVIIEDQIVYFVAAVSVCILNIIELKVNTHNSIVAGALQQARNIGFLCVLGSRLLFNLKEAGKLGVNEGTNYRSSAIEFEEPIYITSTPV